MPAETRLFRCLSDNYGVLLHDPESGATASIDAPEAAPVEAALKATGWKLTDILVTHHHHDHTGGIAELKKKYHCRVVAPAERSGQDPGGRRDRARGRQGFGRKIIGQCDRDARPYARPHHLLVSQAPGRLCRRHAVFHRLRPRDRGHAGDDVEVAPKAARPARRHRDLLRPRIHRRQYQVRAHCRQATIRCLEARAAQVGQLLAEGAPTIPVTIGDEKLANPFLRADVADLAADIGMAGKPADEVFAEIRARKNKF